MATSSEKLTENFEKDTGDDENVTTAWILNMLHPNLDILDKCQSFSSSFNRSVFDGWVKQPSPCCAAAVVAGAWNALTGLHRSNPAALNHQHVLNIYVNISQYSVQTKKLSFERKLGANIDSLLSVVEEELIPTGRQVGGKKDKALTKKILHEVIKSISSKFPARKADVDESKPTSVELLIELFQQEADIRSEIDDLDPLSESDDSNDDVDIKSKRQQPGSSKRWKWESDLLSLLKSIGGVRRLSGEIPSTASIGNWAIIESFKKICDFYNLSSQSVEANLFMGKRSSSRSKIDFPLHVADDENTVNKQWDALRSAFNRRDSVFIFHTTNHYALIFALREWVILDDSSSIHSSKGGLGIDNPQLSIRVESKIVRQALTARKGQRPTAWMDFEDMRSTMLGWEGYKIIKVQRKCSLDDLINSSRLRANEDITVEISS